MIRSALLVYAVYCGLVLIVGIVGYGTWLAYRDEREGKL